jgi:hypothetical protein
VVQQAEKPSRQVHVGCWKTLQDTDLIDKTIVKVKSFDKKIRKCKQVTKFAEENL